MTIVFGTDFSEAAEEAGRVSAYLAKASGAALHIVHVSQDPRAPFVLGTVEERLLSAEHRQLGQVAEQLRREVAIEITTELAAGTVADALVQAAERRLAHALVLGLAGASQAALGGTAERVVQRSRVPVLGVRAGQRLLAWLKGERGLRVLIGSDLGAAAVRAESFLEQLPQTAELSVEVLSVVAARDVNLKYGLDSVDPAELSAEGRALWLRDLEAQGQGFPWRSQRHLSLVASSERPQRELVARSEQADLVLLGARKRSWLEQAWSGSVARGLLREAKTSVLCVPSGIVGGKVEPRPGFRCVVAATDFSVRGDEALSAAFALAQEGGTIYFVHVLPQAAYDNRVEVDAAQHQLHARIPGGHRGHELRSEVIAGAPADALIAFARRVGADALCLGSHRRSSLEARVLGSTLQDLLAQSELPVLVAPPLRD